MSTILTNARKYDWATWQMGIMRAFIAGAAGAMAGGTGPMLLDPKDFNLNSGLLHTLASIGIGCFIGGVTQLGIFLHTHPGPDPVAVDPAIAPNAIGKGQS